MMGRKSYCTPNAARAPMARNGVARTVEVTTGIADGNFRQITGGLASGDQVLLFPDSSVRDGQKVVQRAK